MPPAMDSPWPSAPVLVSMPGILCMSGCPPSLVQCGAVGVQDALVQEPSFGERRVEGQALVAGRQYEPVALRPVRPLRVDPHDLEVESGENVGARQGTADVAGSARLQHPQDVAAHPDGGSLELAFFVCADESHGLLRHFWCVPAYSTMRCTLGSERPPGTYSDCIQTVTSVLASSGPTTWDPSVMMLALLLLRERSVE